jgi:hypothetical protein
LGQAQRPHDGRECIGNGQHFDRLVSAARCHLRFTLDSGVCRTLDLASSVYAFLIQIGTSIRPNQSLQLTQHFVATIENMHTSNFKVLGG